MTTDDGWTPRPAGEHAPAAVDRALEADGDMAARVGYLAVATHFRRPADHAAVADDEGVRRADEAGAHTPPFRVDHAKGVVLARQNNTFCMINTE